MSTALSSSPRTRWRFAGLFGIAAALVVGIVVLAFVWPAATATPRDLPVGLYGPAAQRTALEQALAKQTTDPFTFVSVPSRADAMRRIRDRELYGAVLLGGSPEVLTSSAASTASNQALRGVGSALQAQIASGVERALIGKLQQTGPVIAGLQKELAALQASARSGSATAVSSSPSGSAAAGGATAPASGASAQSSGLLLPSVRITDVVALSSHDSNGAGLASAGFPLVLGGMLGGVLVSLLVAGATRRILALLVYGLIAGPVVTLVLQTWLQILQRDWLANAAAFALAMTATAALVVGCNSLLGQPGIAVGAVISLLIGNPISGATLPYQFIAGPWGTVGQYFVPGAANSLIRSLSYFPTADTGMQWLVLGVWTLGGLVLTVAGHFRSAAPIPLPQGELEQAAV